MKFDGKQLIPYLTAGDPDLETTAKYLDVLEQSPIRIVELGIPFSDPLADGPVIQASHQRAIAAGANLTKVFELLRNRAYSNTPLQVVLMLDYNLILHYGVTAFVSDCANAKVSGILAPNYPLDDPHALGQQLRSAGIAHIHLVSQSTPLERMKTIAAQSSGFLYVLSTTGVTGARAEVSSGAEQTVKKLRTVTDLPLCVGFGISTPEHVTQVLAYADGAIVGSALVKHLDGASNKPSALAAWLTQY